MSTHTSAPAEAAVACAAYADEPDLAGFPSTGLSWRDGIDVADPDAACARLEAESNAFFERLFLERDAHPHRRSADRPATRAHRPAAGRRPSGTRRNPDGRRQHRHSHQHRGTVVQLHTPTELILTLRSMGVEGLSQPFAALVMMERLGMFAADALAVGAGDGWVLAVLAF